jgi:hypothetical protein
VGWWLSGVGRGRGLAEWAAGFGALVVMTCSFGSGSGWGAGGAIFCTLAIGDVEFRVRDSNDRMGVMFWFPRCWRQSYGYKNAHLYKLMDHPCTSGYFR